MKDHSRIKLKACATEDVEMISTLLQDGLVADSDLRYLADEKCFIMVINRFCWELPETGDEKQLYRCMCAVKVGSVKQVHKRGRFGQTNRFYNLLTVTCEETEQRLTFTFSDGYAIRLAVEKLSILVQDMADPHPGFARPQHEDN